MIYAEDEAEVILCFFLAVKTQSLKSQVLYDKINLHIYTILAGVCFRFP